MKIVELLINEEAEIFGMDTVSLVEFPAIESDFVALSSQKVEFKTIDSEKRIVMGAALIPNKPIVRLDDEGKEYFVFFSNATVRRGAELFFKGGHQGSVNLEHDKAVKGIYFFESWIVEGEQDKSRMYGLDAPVGSWLLTAKIENEGIWNEYVKTGKVKGFSIEGYFLDKMKMSVVDELEVLLCKKQ